MSTDKDQTFKTLADAVRYLQDSGHKAEKTKLSKDTKDGLIARTKMGAYSQHALDKYGAAHCKFLVGSDRRDGRLEKLTERKMQADTELAETKARLAQREEQIATRQLIPAADAFRIMAQLVAGIRADIENSIRGKTPESVQKCGGDASRIPDVLAMWTKEHADWMQRFFRSWQDQQPMMIPREVIEDAVRELAGKVGAK